MAAAAPAITAALRLSFLFCLLRRSRRLTVSVVLLWPFLRLAIGQRGMYAGGAKGGSGDDEWRVEGVPWGADTGGGMYAGGINGKGI